MKYYKVDFSIRPCQETACDVLMSLLADIGFESFLPTDEGLVGYVQQTLFDEPALQGVTEGFILPGFVIEYKVSEAPDEDWNLRWEQDGFSPIVLGTELCVHDTRHTDVPACRYDITINPRMAFGTGTHPTTQQVLHQLLDMELEGLRVIDAGCGTGVLGLLASMRGASEVLSYDIDNWSVENTRVNAGLNGIGNLDVREGDASVLDEVRDFDLLVANINRNILLADLPRFVRALKPRAQMLLSGFYEADVPLLVEEAGTLGFCLLRQTVVEGWAMIVMVKGATPGARRRRAVGSGA